MMAIYHKIPRGLMFLPSRLTRLWRKFFPLSCYVIIYDDDSRGREEYYGYFSSRKEAREMWKRFMDCGGENLQPFTNIKLCRIVENWDA